MQLLHNNTPTLRSTSLPDRSKAAAVGLGLSMLMVMAPGPSIAASPNIVDGSLTGCPPRAACVSTSALSLPRSFMPPWLYEPQMSKEKAFRRLLEELEGVGATVQFAEEAADDASPSYISAELQYPASFLRPGADKDQLDFVLREGLILFRAENVQDRPDPPFCLQPGCMNGPIERERMELLRDRLQMMVNETDEDKKWVQIMLH